MERCRVVAALRMRPRRLLGSKVMRCGMRGSGASMSAGSPVPNSSASWERVTIAMYRGKSSQIVLLYIKNHSTAHNRIEDSEKEPQKSSLYVSVNLTAGVKYRHGRHLSLPRYLLNSSSKPHIKKPEVEMKADFNLLVTTNELDNYYLMYFHPSIQEMKSQHPDWCRPKCLSRDHVTYSWVESEHVKYINPAVKKSRMWSMPHC
jgi:hypothetical protein